MGKGKIDLQKKLQKEIQKRKIQIIVFLILSHFEAKMISLYNLTGKNLNKAIENMSLILKNPLPDYSPLDYIKCLLFTVFVYWCVINSNPHRGKKFRPGEEYGDARWGTADDIEPFIDKDFYYNMVFP